MLGAMKEAGRSDSGTVIKKKSSSGCLIIKKKVDSGFSEFNSSKEKKRPRVIESDSESSEYSSETIRHKVDRYHNGSVAYKGAYLENREFDAGKGVSNGLDVFEFDEYDGFDDRRIRKDGNDGRHSWKLYNSQNGNQMQSRNGGSRMSGNKGSGFYYDDKSTMYAKNSGRSTYGNANGFEMEDDESDLPLSVLSERYRLSSNKPIRLQGKNGVLKVMVNKKKQMGVSCRSYDHAERDDQREPNPRVLHKKKLNVYDKSNDHRDPKDGPSSRSGDTNKNKAVMKSSFYLNSKPAEKAAVFKSKDKGRMEVVKLKPMLTKRNTEISEVETPMQLKSYSRREVVKNEGTVNTPTKNVTRVKGKETKVKRGSGTEKQLLREKIKNMLLAAGWTIDYRPRRNRDYLDAVYISPAGTAYWSIIKAYEALQKEEKDRSKAGGNFTPLPDEILGKLTRQTRKKMEREMKKKRKHEGSSSNTKRARVNEDAEDADSDQKEDKLNSYMKQSHKLKKNRLDEASQGSGDDSSENSYDETTVGNSFHTVHGMKSRKMARCTLLVRSSDKGLNSENDGFVPCSEKRTLLSWLIDSGVVHMSEHVEYMNHRKTRVLQKGWITKDGIHCGCCSKILTVLKFELHSGSKLHQPFPNIFLQSGKSLMQCQIDAWNKLGELEKKGFYNVDVDGEDPNDDTCGLCGDGGDLICCDGCPSTFHQSCLDIEVLPQGDWHCPNCSCKYCEIAGGSCTEVYGETEASLLTCCLCQKKYHQSCRPEIDAKPIESNNLDFSFCGLKCQELYSHLQKLVGVKHELDSGFSWSLFHRSDLLADTSLVELSHRVECNSMLAVAMSVMDECFLPFTDRRSQTNLIRNVVFNCGSNLSRINYSGFFTAILERGDETLCAASIRIHGTQLAEMPFIGTRHMHRRQGMCRRLLSAIESALSSLQVEKLVIPAIAEHMNTWTDVFGFHPLEESHKQELRSMNMLVFPGTDMLQKPLAKQDTPNAIPEGNKIVEVAGCKSPSETTTTDSESQESSVPFDHGGDAVSSDNPQVQPLGSLDAQFDSNLQLGNAKVTQECVIVSSDIVSSIVPCEPELQIPVSIDSHSNSIVEEIAVRDAVPVKESFSSMGVDTKSMVEKNASESIYNTADIISFEAPPLNVPSKSTDTASADAIVETGKHVDIRGKEGGYESGMNTQEKERGIIEKPM